MNALDISQYELTSEDSDWRTWKPYLGDSAAVEILNFVSKYPGNKNLPLFKFQFFMDGKPYGAIYSCDVFSRGAVAQGVANVTGVIVRYSAIFDIEAPWYYVTP